MIYGIDHTTGEPTNQLMRKRQRDTARAEAHRKAKAEQEHGTDVSVRVPIGGDSSSPSVSPASRRGSSASASFSASPSRVVLVPSGHEGTFKSLQSVPSAVSARGRPEFRIPRLPAHRRIGQKEIPSLMSLVVKPPLRRLGRGRGSDTEGVELPLVKARAMTMERPDGSSFVPDSAPTARSRATRTERRLAPRPASASPALLLRRPLPEVEIRFEQHGVTEATKDRSSSSPDEGQPGTSDGRLGSDTYVWMLPSLDSDSDRDTSRSAARCRSIVWESSKSKGKTLIKGRRIPKPFENTSGAGEREGQQSEGSESVVQASEVTPMDLLMAPVPEEVSGLHEPLQPSSLPTAAARKMDSVDTVEPASVGTVLSVTSSASLGMTFPLSCSAFKPPVIRCVEQTVSPMDESSRAPSPFVSLRVPLLYEDTLLHHVARCTRDVLRWHERSGTPIDLGRTLDGIIIGMGAIDPATKFMVRLIAGGVLANYDWMTAEDTLLQQVADRPLPLSIQDLVWRTGLSSTILLSHTSQVDMWSAFAKTQQAMQADALSMASSAAETAPAPLECTVEVTQGTLATLGSGLHDPTPIETGEGLDMGRTLGPRTGVGQGASVGVTSSMVGGQLDLFDEALLGTSRTTSPTDTEMDESLLGPPSPLRD